MAFVRFIGCSVGKKICAACDTDFDRALPWRGGSVYTEHQLVSWAAPYRRICLTGGEPLDQDLMPLLRIRNTSVKFHIETSGTVPAGEYLEQMSGPRLWICVSPKPGFRQDMIELADEIKIIVPGLGPGDGWPTLNDALDWAELGKLVYLQPKNRRMEIDRDSLMYVQDIVREYPQLRMSVQMHKILKVQ
jgi:organic radical activating enzyme